MRNLLIQNVFLLILFLAFILRIIFLNEIPPGIAHDEIHVILNAASIAKSGEPIPGTLTGIIGQANGEFESGVFSELGSYLLIPWAFVFGISWPWIKFPFVLVGLSTIFLVYKLAQKLTNAKVGLLAALVLTVSPWSVHFSRSAFESVFSFFFYLLAVYLVLTLRGWRILYSIPFFILGFSTYFAAKPQLIPLGILSLLIIKLTDTKSSHKPALLLITILLLFTAAYTIVLQNNPASHRTKELQNTSSTTASVNIKRTQSLDVPLGSIFVNKYTEDIRERLDAYFGGLSPSFLFLKGQTGGAEALSLSDYGPFHLVDLPLIIIGVIYLSRFYLSSLTILFGLITVSLIPGFFDLSGRTYILRAGLMFPVSAVMTAAGIWYSINLLTRFKIRFTPQIIIICYLLFSSVFFYQYFARTPIEKNEGWFFQERLLAKYLDLSQKGHPQNQILIATTEPKQAAYEYLFFANLYTNKEQIKTANNALASKAYNFEKIQFINHCPKIQGNLQQTVIIDTRLNCQDKSSNVIASPKDNGVKYFLLNERLCLKTQKNRYPLVKKVSDLNIEQKSIEEFCSFWVTNPS